MTVEGSWAWFSSASKVITSRCFIGRSSLVVAAIALLSYLRTQSNLPYKTFLQRYEM